MQRRNAEAGITCGPKVYVNTVTLTEDGAGKIEATADPKENSCSITNT